MQSTVYQNIHLENEYVRLEPLKESHYEALLDICLAYPNLLAYSPSPFGSASAFQEYYSLATNTAHRHAFAIYDKRIDTYVGSTSYGSYDAKNRNVEIGWTWLAKEAQGTGINGFCKAALLKYAFEVLEVTRVSFRIDERNKASRRAVEKLGAVLEGVLRKDTLMRDGFMRSTAVYSILTGEWN